MLFYVCLEYTVSCMKGKIVDVSSVCKWSICAEHRHLNTIQCCVSCESPTNVKCLARLLTHVVNHPLVWTECMCGGQLSSLLFSSVFSKEQRSNYTGTDRQVGSESDRHHTEKGDLSEWVMRVCDCQDRRDGLMNSSLSETQSERHWWLFALAMAAYVSLCSTLSWACPPPGVGWQRNSLSHTQPHYEMDRWPCN